MTLRNPTDELKKATSQMIQNVKRQYFQYLIDHKDILSRSELKQKDRIDITSISKEGICTIEIPEETREWGKTQKDNIFDLLLPEAVIQTKKNEYLHYQTEPTSAKNTMRIKSCTYQYENGIWQQIPYVVYQINTERSETYAAKQNFNESEDTKNIATLWEIQDLDKFYYKYTQKDFKWTKAEWNLFTIMVEYNKKSSKERREKYGTVLYLDTIFMTNLYLNYCIAKNRITELPKTKDRFLYQIGSAKLRSQTQLPATITTEPKPESKPKPETSFETKPETTAYGHFRVYKDGTKVWIPEIPKQTRK